MAFVLKSGISFSPGINLTTKMVWSLRLQVEVEVYACTGFLLLCITTFVPRTIEILHVNTLTLPLENLKLQSLFLLSVFHDI